MKSKNKVKIRPFKNATIRINGIWIESIINNKQPGVFTMMIIIKNLIFSDLMEVNASPLNV